MLSSVEYTELSAQVAALRERTTALAQRSPLPLPPQWTEQAACWQSARDPEDWFARPGSEEFLAAQAICGTCPVRAQCYQMAEDNDESDGTWGGSDFRKDPPVPTFRIL